MLVRIQLAEPFLPAAYVVSGFFLVPLGSRVFKTSNPLPGDIGLVPIGGFVGACIRAGQSLIGSGSRFTHAFVVLENGLVIQAEPGGAVIVPLADAVKGREVVYSDFPLTQDERDVICAAAPYYEHTPYSYLEYPAIGARRLLHSAILERFVADDGHMICSQLATVLYGHAGYDMFPHKLAGDVVPGDIARLIGAS